MSIPSESVVEEFLRYIDDIVSNGDIFGSKYYIQPGIPDNDTGLNDDVWVNSTQNTNSTYDFYQKINDVWVLQWQIGDKHFIHIQNTPSATWTVNHTMNKIPAVTVFDDQGVEIFPSIEYPSTSQLVIEFVQGGQAANKTGTVYLN